ncbi:MAG: tyrosine--tRNA ligase, partial [Bacteroidetes bacterium]
DEGKRVRLDETEYPIMQGYDSYFMDTDIQIGGTDQTFNMQAGRILQKNLRHKESFIIATEFLMGTDGRKMSKSWGNAIWLDDIPEDIYAKVLAIKDDLIIPYYTLATNLPLDEIREIKNSLEKGSHPMPIKKKLAFEIVSELYDKNAAQKAQEYFERTVQQKEKPQDIKKIVIPYLSKQGTFNIIDLLVEQNIVSSRGETKRLIKQGGIKINDAKIKSQLEHISTEKLPIIIQIGKYEFYSIVEK